MKNLTKEIKRNHKKEMKFEIAYQDLHKEIMDVHEPPEKCLKPNMYELWDLDKEDIEKYNECMEENMIQQHWV